MTPMRIVPKFGVLPELLTYRCQACGHVESIEMPEQHAAGDMTRRVA
jgi:hypothetical protein